jgi:hypothetical protein
VQVGAGLHISTDQPSSACTIALAPSKLSASSSVQCRIRIFIPIANIDTALIQQDAPRFNTWQQAMAKKNRPIGRFFRCCRAT